MRFKVTKKSRLERARALIDRNLYDQPFSAPDLAEFCELTNSALLWACRKRNPTFPNDPRHVHVLRAGWTTPAEWSWLKAINIDLGRSPEEAAEARRKHNELDALRFAIRAEMRAFLDAQWPAAACEACGTTDDLTTDHAGTPFHTIAEAFLAQSGPLQLKPLAGAGDVLADPEVEARWLAYHASRATYEVLCVSHNSIKGKRW